MSHRYAGSRSSSGKDDLSVAQDRVTPKRVAQARLLDEMDLTPEDLPEVLLHGHQVEQAPRRVSGEGHQDIEVAVGPEVVAQHRSEQGQLRDPLQRRQKSATAAWSIGTLTLIDTPRIADFLLTFGESEQPSRRLNC
jgi:hypothetical protein